MAWGFYRVGQTNHEQSGEKMEERKQRYILAPYLQAEEDKRYNEREKYIRNKELEIMKDVPDWKARSTSYLTDRWVPRIYAPLDKNLKK